MYQFVIKENHHGWQYQVSTNNDHPGTNMFSFFDECLYYLRKKTYFKCNNEKVDEQPTQLR